MTFIQFSLALLSSLLGFRSSEFSTPPRPDAQPVEWKCEDAKWVVPAHKNNGQVVGTVAADCTFTGQTGGGFVSLRKYLIARTEKEAKTIHSGPTVEKYADMDSVAYDVTVNFKNDQGSITMRELEHIATDEKTKLVFDAFSKEISGTGEAWRLKKLDTAATVLATDVKDHYQLRMSVSFGVAYKFLEAPFAVGAVKGQIEKNVAKTEKEIIEEMARNM